MAFKVYFGRTVPSGPMKQEHTEVDNCTIPSPEFARLIFYLQNSVEPIVFFLVDFDTFSILELCNRNQQDEFMTGFIIFHIKQMTRQYEIYFYLKVP